MMHPLIPDEVFEDGRRLSNKLSERASGYSALSVILAAANLVAVAVTQMRAAQPDSDVIDFARKALNDVAGLLAEETQSTVKLSNRGPWLIARIAEGGAVFT